ncbi:MAG: hypothetical protein ACRC2R_20745 [Xenococcaceae cyanobacterium]
MHQENRHPIADYLPLLCGGEFDRLCDLFANQPLLDDPLHGQIEGIDRFKQFVKASHEWLTQRNAWVEHLSITCDRTRVIEECILHLVQDNVAIALPVAIVGDLVSEGLTFVRVYHSMWTLLGKHIVRSPIIAKRSHQILTGAIGIYQDALTKGDLETIVRQFEPNGYFREPSGEEYIYRGLDKIRHIFEILFSNGGGIPLEHCSVTDDGIRCAIEYNLSSWGRTKIPPQAGVAVYERSFNGLLAAARIYDDIAPPIATE